MIEPFIKSYTIRVREVRGELNKKQMPYSSPQGFVRLWIRNHKAVSTCGLDGIRVRDACLL